MKQRIKFYKAVNYELAKEIALIYFKKQKETRFLSFNNWLLFLKAEQILKNPPKINRINYINGIKQ